MNGWNKLGSRFIRKSTLYEMCWNNVVFNSNSISSVSLYGALIAIVKHNGANKHPEIHVYNAAGKELSRFTYKSWSLKGICWTNADEILCLQEDGFFSIHDIFGTMRKSIERIKHLCSTHKVVEFEVFLSNDATETGIVVMSGSGQFHMINNIEDVKLRTISHPGNSGIPPVWCSVPSTRSCKILAACDNNLYLLDYPDQFTLQHPSEMEEESMSIEIITLSLDGKHVAFFYFTNENKGRIWMGSSDFKKKYCDVLCLEGKLPKQMVFCSNCIPSFAAENHHGNREISLLVYSMRQIVVVGESGQSVVYDVMEDYGVKSGVESTKMWANVDGVHIVSSQRHDFVQHVPKTVEDIFTPGSLAPGAVLYDASRQYERHSEKASEYLTLLKERDELDVAVEQCIITATFEFSTEVQKHLIRAASFGKSFVHGDLQLTELFLNANQYLRVLNNLRYYEVGIAMTAAQLQHLKMDRLIARLVVRRLFKLAFHMCRYLGMPHETGSSRVLSYWACHKVTHQSRESDDQIAKVIRAKLKGKRGVSYANIAAVALKAGKRNLATKLLEYETRSVEQVRLLSELNEHKMAVEKSVESGNTDLIYEVMDNLKNSTGHHQFLVYIRQHPIAYNLYMKRCRMQNSEELKNLYTQEDNFEELAYLNLNGDQDYYDNTVQLHQALDCFNRARNEFNVKATEEQIQLVKQQSEVSKETGENFSDLSLHDTMLILLSNKQFSKAEKLRKNFKVSDKRWWWVKVTALADQRMFAELEQFSKQKKSPIGYMPFLEACVRNNSPENAEKYIPKIPKNQLVAALVKIGDMRKAFEVASQNKNRDELQLVYKKCRAEDKLVKDKIIAFVNQLG